MVRSGVANARPGSRRRRRDLDSEGDNERSLFERPPLARLEARAQVSRRRGESEAWNNEGVLRVRSVGGSQRVFANKRDRRADVGSAVVVGAHAWGRRGVLLRARSGSGVGTPDAAQQAGVLPNCQRQHDRKESGSKHVMLAIHKGKSYASQKRRGPQETPTFSRSRCRRPGEPAEFRRSVPRIPQRRRSA
jgi:hypothetical protein